MGFYHQGLQQVLHIMWMAHPNQADSLQGSQCGNVEMLAANDQGIGSGWRQSKQNLALSAVVGKWARVICNDLCWRTTGVTPSTFVTFLTIYNIFSIVRRGAACGGGFGYGLLL